MVEGEGRGRPDIWRPHVVSIVTQVLLILVGLILMASGGVELGAGYAAVNWGQEGAGAGAVLFLAGLGGAGVAVLGAMRLLPSRRTGLHLLVTAEGIEHKHEGERTLLAWDDIGTIEPRSQGGVPLPIPQGRFVQQSLGFSPNQKLIQIRDTHGRAAGEWQCRSFVADPVDVLELLRRRHDEARAPR